MQTLSTADKQIDTTGRYFILYDCNYLIVKEILLLKYLSILSLPAKMIVRKHWDLDQTTWNYTIKHGQQQNIIVVVLWDSSGSIQYPIHISSHCPCIVSSSSNFRWVWVTHKFTMQSSHSAFGIRSHCVSCVVVCECRFQLLKCNSFLLI